jgi:heavy-metal-associated domain-containing protein
MGSQAHIAHHVPGRLRFRIPDAKGNPERLEQARTALEVLEGVRSVDVNPLTGSVVIEYDPEDYEDFHHEVCQHCVQENICNMHPHPPAPASAPDKPAAPKIGKVDDTLDKIESEARFLASRSTTAKAIVDFLRDCDVKVKETTNNAVDLKVLVPLGLAVYSIVVIELTAATPMWVTLGLFSFNHFLELHSHDAQPDAEQNGSPARKPAMTLRQY